MDKWDDMVERVKNGILAEEPAATLAAGLQLFAEFGRSLELISADTDRLATAAERLVECAERTAAPEISGSDKIEVTAQ